MVSRCRNCDRPIARIPGSAELWIHEGPERVGYSCTPEIDGSKHAEPADSQPTGEK